MKKIYSSILVFGFFLQFQVFGQITLGSSPYLQDFNSISGGLPAGWTVRTGATASALGTTATLVTAQTAWNSTTGNFRNVAAAAGLSATSTTTDQNNSTNRALAVRQTGSFGDPGAAFVLQLSNTSGLNNFQLTFKLQSLDGSAAGRTTTWRVDYGTGASPTTFSTVATSPASLNTTLAAGGTSWGSTDVTVNFGNVLDNSSSNVWIRIATTSASTGSGSRPTSAIDDIQLTYSSVDTTPPTFTTGYPKATTLATDGFSLVSNINEAGKTYFVVLANGANAPTAAQVKAGTDASDSALPSGFFGSVVNTSANTDFSSFVNGLNSSTDYDVYVVAEDASGNLQTSAVKLDVLTLTAGDVTPPNFTSSYPLVNLIQSTGFTVRTNLDEPGKTYFVVLPTGATIPTSAQVKNGQDANSTNLNLNLIGAINVNASGTEFTSVVTGLNASTTYDVFVVAEDNVPNIQSNPVKITVTTGPQFIEDFSACDGTASFSSVSVTGAQVWGCTDFGRGGTKGIRINGFAGTAQLNEDWLISPPTSLTANANLQFYSQFSFAGPSLQLKISTDYSGAGDPNTGTWVDLNGNFPTVAVSSASTSLADWTLSTVDLSAYAGQSVYVAFVYTSTTGTNTAARWTLDDITINNGVARYLQTSISSVLFNAGGSVKSYKIKGFNLGSDVTITAPTNFQISKDNSSFLPSINFTSSEVNVPQTVYVKFSPASSTANTITGTVTNESSGVSTKNVSVSGTDKSLTFDITCYNLEFFGTNVTDATGKKFGPPNVTTQIANVTTVLQTVQSDIFGVEEIADDNSFNTLVANLPGYDKVVSNRWSYSFDPPDPNFPPQKTGFIYNKSTVQLIGTRVMFEQLYDAVRGGNTSLLPGYPTTGGSTPSNFWSSGRLPFMATFDVTINGLKKRIRVVDIHAKSGSDQASYDRRKYDVQVLRDSLVANYPNDNVILVGDFNDDVDNSITSGQPSTYQSLVGDAANFNTLTLPLSQGGVAASFPSSNSFIDHIIISNELSNAYLANSTTVEDARAYVTNYVNTTSDHLPVSARFLFSVKTDQAITFNSLPQKTFGDAPFNISASATSGLPVTFVSSDPTIASINGNTVTILKGGTVNITASQPGDDSYNAAADVAQVLTINKANQTITFGALITKTFGDSPFNLSASASSGLTVTYTSSDPTVASITGSTVTILKAGAVTITASQAGNAGYNAAVDVAQALTITKANQTITFNPLPLKIFGDPAFAVSATASSGLSVTITSSDATIASVTGNTVTILKAGSVNITASQTGNGNYNAATDVVQALTINKSNQQISFSVIADKVQTDAPFALTATATSALPVIFSSLTTDKVTVSGNQATIVAPGRAVLLASQGGNVNYNAALPTSQSFCIKPTKPTIAVTTTSGSTTLTCSASGGYKWFVNGVVIPNATNQTYVATQGGTYKVQVNVDDCVSDFSNDVPVIITGDLTFNQTDVYAYPNPTHGTLFIVGLEPDTKSCSVTDVLGRSVEMTLEKAADQHILQTESFVDGVHTIRIKQSNSVKQIRFVKNN